MIVNVPAREANLSFTLEYHRRYAARLKRSKASSDLIGKIAHRV